MNWHSISEEEVLKQLDSSKDGLTDAKASERLGKYGPNELKEIKKKSPILMFFEQFRSFLIIILIFAALISFVFGEVVDGIVIAIVIVLNACIGFYQERKAQIAIASLKRLASPQADVYRDGNVKTVYARELVPGDVIILDAGKKIPADARIIESMNLRVDESVLTGESVPVEKTVDKLNENIEIADMENMLFAGTTVTYGRAKAVVVETGMNTQVGKIAGLVQEEQEQTLLQIRLEKLGKQLIVIIAALCVVIFALDFLRGNPMLNAFMTSVAIAVAAIPEGMPAIVTITLAIGVQRMAKRNAIVRRIHSVETLGCTDVICTDKTGTLTMNQMTVRKIYANEKIIDVTGEGYNKEGKFLVNGSEYTLDEDIKTLLRTGLLCNDANLQDNGIVGDPMEAALVVVALKGMEDMREQQKRIDEIPFDSVRKMMTTINEYDGKKISYTKGAPEIVLAKCSMILKNGSVVPMTDDDRKKINEINNNLTNDAMRTLAFAYKNVNEYTKDLLEKELVFIGIVGLRDPPRKEAKESVELCKKAGINVVMITGDHKNTALAIGKELGIYEEGKLVLTGEELNKKSDEELEAIVEDVCIYARVSPEHKLRIVQALRNKKHVTAMIGDGVNDAPALKKSDIAVTVGAGTDVAKEVSDMILTDNNFATVVSAVEEGRNLYDNIRKTINYLLSCNFGEILTILTAIIINLPTPLIPIQILWMNLVTDGLPALALGVDKGDPDVMTRKPRSRNEKILNKQSIFFILAVGFVMCLASISLFVITLEQGFVRASTVAFTSIIIMQMLFALISRSEKHTVLKLGLFSNKKLLIAIAVSIILQLMIIYLPFFNGVFRTEALSMIDWARILAVSLTVFIIFEAVKIYKYRSAARNNNL
jgi:P-type Ca2+ transporter type 2C